MVSRFLLVIHQHRHDTIGQLHLPTLAQDRPHHEHAENRADRKGRDQPRPQRQDFQHRCAPEKMMRFSTTAFESVSLFIVFLL